MVVEIVCVGTELLLGNIVNTNAAFLAEQCAALGLSCYYQSVVGDNEERLGAVLKMAMERSDVVILCGGLGPTPDDLTKETAAKVCGMPLAEDAHTRERIEAYFEKSQWKIIPDNNWKQAEGREGAIVVDNYNGTAPGLILETGEKTVILLPGPPNEMIPMFKEQIAPYLNRLQPEMIVSKMIKLAGIGESQVADEIDDLIQAQTNPTIATYAKTGEVHLRVTAKVKNEDEAKRLIKPVVKLLRERFGNYIYSVKENETLEEAVVKLLGKYGLSLTTAESCTGGLLAGRLVNVPGVSEVFKQGFVTYSDKSKRKLLDVNKATLKKYGAVSEETVKEMAKGGMFATDSDVCVAITGIAGPDGGSEDKPVGTVYIGCYINNKMNVEKYLFKGNRAKIREYSVVRALDLLRRSILENYGEGK